MLDVINEVANTQPVSAQNLGTILQKSAAAMSAAGNSFEETVALGTAMNSVLQNADQTGTAIKTLSMYLRASTTELEANGESAEGCAKSMSDLRAKIKALTGGAVDIMGANDAYKSTYQILKEISEVYDSMSDINQASLLELIAGKRNANAVSAVLKQFSIAEDSLKSAQDSAGSAAAENEKYLDSIQGRVAQLDSAFQKLSNDVLDSSIVKQIVSFATGVTDVADGLARINMLLPVIATGAAAIFNAKRKDKNGAGKQDMPFYAHCQFVA